MTTADLRREEKAWWREHKKSILAPDPIAVARDDRRRAAEVEEPEPDEGEPGSLFDSREGDDPEDEE